MQDILAKIKIFYKQITTRKISYEKPGVSPVSDWRKLLTVTLVLVIGLGIFSFYFYELIDQGKIFVISGDDSNKENKINMPLLEKIVEEANKRQESMEKINQIGVSVSDPSL